MNSVSAYCTKKLFFLFLLTGFLCCLAGCAHNNYDTDYADVIDHFIKSGLKIESIQPLNHYVVGAESAFSFRIAGREIGIYKYNPKNHKQKVRLERVDRTGIFYVVGQKFQAVRNGCYVMIDFDKNKESKKILKAFRSF